MKSDFHLKVNAKPNFILMDCRVALTFLFILPCKVQMCIHYAWAQAKIPCVVRWYCSWHKGEEFFLFFLTWNLYKSNTPVSLKNIIFTRIWCAAKSILLSKSEYTRIHVRHCDSVSPLWESFLINLGINGLSWVSFPVSYGPVCVTVGWM